VRLSCAAGVEEDETRQRVLCSRQGERVTGGGCESVNAHGPRWSSRARRRRRAHRPHG
jgi:hypothetical protein